MLLMSKSQMLIQVRVLDCTFVLLLLQTSLLAHPILNTPNITCLVICCQVVSDSDSLYKQLRIIGSTSHLVHLHLSKISRQPRNGTSLAVMLLAHGLQRVLSHIIHEAQHVHIIDNVLTPSSTCDDTCVPYAML